MASITPNEASVVPAPKEAGSSRHVHFMEPQSIKRPDRQRPAHLRPLATSHINSHIRQHTSPHMNHPHPDYSMSPGTPSSATSLATPSLLGVRQYYRENGLYTAFQAPSPPPPTSARSRRDSGLSPTSLNTCSDGFPASSPLSPNSSPRFPLRSLAEESRDMLLAGTNRRELSRAGSAAAVDSARSPTRRTSEPQFNRPSKPPPDRLREFGYVYLGDAATADVFVRALHIRRPDPLKDRRDSVVMPLNNGEDDSYIVVPQSDKDHFVIRARVIPLAKHRRPFLIQRRFNRAEIEGAQPVGTKETKGEGETENPGAESVRGDEGAERNNEKLDLQGSQEKSASTPSPQPDPAQSSAQNGAQNRMRNEDQNGTQKETQKEAEPLNTSGPIGKVKMPIHMTYALTYLPMLGALMLSGHIRKGDTIEIPLPHPEAWRDTVAYAYTGAATTTATTTAAAPTAEASDAVMVNMAYLAGRGGGGGSGGE